MNAVTFDLKGKLAHFRRPDTTATQLTYPFITPTAAKGLVGAVLGITDFKTDDKVGVQLLHPVKTIAQQLSMIGKDAGPSFNRPTTIELLVNPYYRIYYAGSEHVDELADKLIHRLSVYPTYLGVAYALTFPEFVDYEKNIELIENERDVTTQTVIPTSVIGDLIMDEGRYYSRAGGFMKNYLGDRTFEESVSFLYERNGQSIRFIRKTERQKGEQIVRIGGKTVCLI